MLQGTHILKSFDEDLTQLNDYLVTMTQYLINEVSILLKYFNSKHNSLINEILEIEDKINLANQKALDLTLEIFTLRSPVASDLRYVFAASQIARSLERNGDHIKKSINTISCIEHKDEELDKLIIIMLEKNITMLNLALNAFIKRDSCLITIAEINDDETNEAFKSLCDLLLKKIKENPENIQSFYNYLFLGKRIEQMGDYLYNIKPLLSFIETGKFPEE